MNADTFRDIEKLESDLWEAAEHLRANCELTSSDYLMPVLGGDLPTARRQPLRGRRSADRAAGQMPKRKVLPADYLRRRAVRRNPLRSRNLSRARPGRSRC